MQATLTMFDADGNAKLDRDEFVGFARSLFNSGPVRFRRNDDSVWA